MQALHKRGISVNRARRACVATRNASREDALAWCFEHSADPAMDAPFVPSRARSAGRPAGAGSGGRGGGGGAGGTGGAAGREREEEELRAAARYQGKAAAALEAYVRARLSAIERGGGGDGPTGGRGGGGGGSGVRAGARGARVPSEEVEELAAVLASFRRRQSLGQAEEKARAVLPGGVDLLRFAEDQGYRQVCVRNASTGLWSGPVLRSCTRSGSWGCFFG